jgi:hypothetical protein
MESATKRTAVEPRRWFYLRAVAFLVPALVTWAYSVRYLYPRLQAVWREGGGAAPDVQWLMQGVGLMVGYGGWAAVVFLAAVVTSEWRSAGWRRYRRAIVGSGVLLLNATVLVGITAMCLLLTCAAPGLMRAV